MQNPSWLNIALNELGVAERKNGENPKIIEYHRTTYLQANRDEVPWCSSFVNWVLMKSGLERTKSAAARSWLNYGFQVKSLIPGAIVILSRNGSPEAGHVGFFIKDKDKHNFYILGGKQSDKVSIQLFPKNRILGARWPLKIEEKKPEVKQELKKEQKNGK
jgi:uncharacterized protein (TIGR02594 family)